MVWVRVAPNPAVWLQIPLFGYKPTVFTRFGYKPTVFTRFGYKSPLFGYKSPLFGYNPHCLAVLASLPGCTGTTAWLYWHHRGLLAGHRGLLAGHCGLPGWPPWLPRLGLVPGGSHGLRNQCHCVPRVVPENKRHFI